MACNCKVKEQIDYLHKTYGDNIPKGKKTDIDGMVKTWVRSFFSYLFLLPILPIMGIYALAKGIKGKPVHMDKIILANKNNNENVGEQQVI